MPATMNLGLEEIKALILQFNNDEKIELSKYLDKLTINDRFEKLFSSLKEIPLSFDDVTKEVETVREEMHKYHLKKP